MEWEQGNEASVQLWTWRQAAVFETITQSKLSQTRRYSLGFVDWGKLNMQLYDSAASLIRGSSKAAGAIYKPTVNSTNSSVL